MALRRAIREGRTTEQDVQAWLGVLDSYNIQPIDINPVAGFGTWLSRRTLSYPFTSWVHCFRQGKGIVALDARPGRVQ